MPTLSYKGISWNVDHAVKGINYVHGYSPNGNCIVSIEDTSDFDNIKYDGTYLAPEACVNEPCNEVVHVNGSFARRDGQMLTPDKFGAAPAGYGLGENIGNVAPSSGTGDYDANEIITSGWWRAKTSCPANGWWSILHIAHTEDYATQYAFAYWDISAENSGTVIKRYKYKGTWNPWEYVNPPMVPGVEYHTTERFCDKPVYWKLVDIGALPNASSIKVEHKIANIEYLVHKSLTTGYYLFPCHWGGNDIGDTEIYVNSNSIMVKTTVDWSSYNGYAFLKYTKTTD